MESIRREFHDCKWDMTNLMNALVLCHIEVFPFGMRCVYIISTINSMLHNNFYEVIVGCYLGCISLISYQCWPLLFKKKENMSHSNTCISFMPK